MKDPEHPELGTQPSPVVEKESKSWVILVTGPLLLFTYSCAEVVMVRLEQIPA